MGKDTLRKPNQITSALSIPTPVGNTIVSLTTTQTTPTPSTSTCALSVGEELIRMRTQVGQQNAQLPQQLARVFAKGVKPLLEVHRTAAQKALGSSSSALIPISGSASGPSSGPAKGSHPSSGPAKGPHASSARNRPLPQATQPSPIGTSTDNSSAAYSTPNETMDPFGMFEVEQDVLGDGQLYATPQPWVVKIKTGQGSISSVSTAPSPAISKGKDMARMKQLAEQEREEERQAKAERNKQTTKAEKRKAVTPSSSRCSFTTSSSEEEEPAEKIQATRKGKKPTKKALLKVPSKRQMASKPRRKRSLEDLAQSSMRPPATGKVKRERRSVLQTSTSASNTSVVANVSIKKPTPDEAQAQELSSSSASDTQPAKKENVNVDMMVELNAGARKE